ncbi:MAG: PilZ domain-containing protein [Alphaproteobacteria bacterium]|nr:PilZ domain-containing protein [Alphaproteobacteria bacterium]MBV9693343.1 PilZ domain-containing protein [Alphaproteobacteria bacterium]
MKDIESVIAKAKAERRRFRRVRVDLKGRLFVPADSRECHCKVIDLSPGGASLECELALEQGTPIVLYVDGFGRLEGNVVRNAAGDFGVRFSCTPAKRERIAEQLTLFMNRALVDASELRRHDRTPTKGIARFTRADGQFVACEVLDLSVSGVSLKTDVRPPLGEFVLIGQMAGRVARHHDQGIGIEFVGGTPVSADRLQPARTALAR